jgi:hypothetical protein
MYLSDSLASPNYDDGLINLRTDDRRFECWINVPIVLFSELEAFEELVSVNSHVMGCLVSDPPFLRAFILK